MSIDFYIVEPDVVLNNSEWLETWDLGGVVILKITMYGQGGGRGPKIPKFLLT